MKVVSGVALLALLLAGLAVAQGRPGGASDRETSEKLGRPDYDIDERIDTYLRTQRPDDTDERALPPGIGICLIGEKYGYIDDLKDADKCDAVMWVDTVGWADNQRKLIDESILSGTSTTNDDGSVVCRSCAGTCQTVALPITESTYEDVETDGGQSPSECLASIEKACESRPFRHFTSARCGN
jgi:hypothetical protein